MPNKRLQSDLRQLSRALCKKAIGEISIMIGKNIYYLFLITLLAGCANQHIDYSSHPLVGRWSWDVDGCIETYNFQKDGVRKGNSFREIVEAEYRVSIKPLDSGFYRLYDKVTYENGAEDCAGSTKT